MSGWVRQQVDTLDSVVRLDNGSAVYSVELPLLAHPPLNMLIPTCQTQSCGFSLCSLLLSCAVLPSAFPVSCCVLSHSL